MRVISRKPREPRNKSVSGGGGDQLLLKAKRKSQMA